MINPWFCCSVIAILNIDTTSFLQSSLSRPSVVGLICGSLCGYPVEAFLAGLLIEFFVLDFPPIGGMPVPNGCIASGICAILIPGCGVYYSFFIGLFSGIIYSYIEKIIRQKRIVLNIIAETIVNSYNFNFGRLIFTSIIVELIISFFYLSFFYFIFSNIYRFIPITILGYMNESLKLSFISVIFVVFSSLFFKFLTQVKKNA